MQWRNDQIDILRQKEPLTPEKQEYYFRTVVDKLFTQERPDQLLFSFLENDMLVGYGGLVHIDWESNNAEISFITATGRNKTGEQFKNDWNNYLKMVKKIAQRQLNFTKIYTYAYDVRPLLFQILIENDFVEEARLLNHVSIRRKFHDVLIHSFFFDTVVLKRATEEDVLLYFAWANDELVRLNSFNTDPIGLVGHTQWFKEKINDPNCLMLIAQVKGEFVGQIRFDQTLPNTYELDFSVDKESRGKGMGSRLIKMGTEELLKAHPSVRIVGKVKKSNVSSGRSFVNAGYTLSLDSSSEIDTYHFDNRDNP